MDSLSMLSLTNKGKDEVEHRSRHLGIMPRSILLLLSRPQTIELVQNKTAFHREDVLAMIRVLVDDGYVALSPQTLKSAPPTSSELSSQQQPCTSIQDAPTEKSETAKTGKFSLADGIGLLGDFARITPDPTPVAASAKPKPSSDHPEAEKLRLANGVVLSEAKLLLIDFCIEHFGMRSGNLIKIIVKSATIDVLNNLLTKLTKLTAKLKPDQLGTLGEIVKRANEMT